MKSEIISQEKNVVIVRANFEAAEVDKSVAGVVRDMSRKANIKGFRKGHVPRKMLEMYFTRGAIYKEAAEEMLQSAFNEIVSEYDLDLVIAPKIDAKELKEGEPLEVTFTFEVRPEVTLPDIASLEAEKTIYKVEQKDIDEQFTQALEYGATFEPIDDDRPATADDVVETQYTSYKLVGDDKQELERDQKNTMNIATLRKDIADSIIGRKPAEEFSFDIKLEDDYPDKRLAGATLHYEMEILHFLRRVVPEGNDETIDRLTSGRFKTVDEFKADIKRHLEEVAAARSDASLRESALEKLAEAATVDVPSTMIDRQYDAMRREESAQIQRDLSQSLEEYLQHNSLSVTEFEANLRKSAERIVRNTLVLDALAERDEISFEQDDLSEEVLNMAQAMRVNPQELADRLSKDRDQFTAVANRVRTKNTLKHLATLVKVKEVDAPKDEPQADKAEAEESK